MKKVSFLSLVFLTYYLAGMYRSLPLMTLGVMEMVLLMLMMIQPLYFKEKISASFLKTGESTEAGSKTQCCIVVRNLSRLPVNRLELRLRIRYPQDIWGVNKKIYGSAERGEDNLAFEISAKYCGLVKIKMDRIRVFDYLALFGSGKKLAEEMKIAVFPKERAFHIRLSDISQGSLQEKQTISGRGDDYDEIYQIREYRNGDFGRHIHWNQSAKTESLWIKEYNQETDIRMHILIDSTGFSMASAAELSMFYKALFALMLGLLKEVSSIRIHWYHNDRENFEHMDGANAQQCRDVLLQLYQTEFISDEDFPIKKAFDQCETHFQNILRLTLELSLFRGDTLACQFSPEKLDRGILEEILII